MGPARLSTRKSGGPSYIGGADASCLITEATAELQAVAMEREEPGAWRRRAGDANVAGVGSEELKPRLLGLDNCGFAEVRRLRTGGLDGLGESCTGIYSREDFGAARGGAPNQGLIPLSIGIHIVGCPWRSDPSSAIGSRRRYANSRFHPTMLG